MGDESIQIEFTFWNKDLEKSQEPKLRQAAVPPRSGGTHLHSHADKSARERREAEALP